MVSSLFTTDKSEPDTPPPLTAEAITHALASTEPMRAYAAAYLTGRAKADDATVDQSLTQNFESLLTKSQEGAKPTTANDVLIEAAMSLALRGNIERAHTALLNLLHSPDPLGDQYKAAFYLAELGDPSGYPALLATLQSNIPHYRLMALRHALVFHQYDGQTVNNTRIDVLQLLTARLHDPDPLVRSEAPFYLEELHPPNLRDLLHPVEQTDPSPDVRTAARIVLDRNS
jgi:HEAT repeat protein